MTKPPENDDNQDHKEWSMNVIPPKRREVCVIPTLLVLTAKMLLLT